MSPETITLHDIQGFARKSGTDADGNQWIEYELDQSGSDLPDGETETDTCCVCSAPMENGWLCLDGGETACASCIVLDESGFDKAAK